MLVKQEEKKLYYKVFLLHFVTAFLAFAGILLQEKGMFTISTDYNNQQLAFSSYMNQMIKQGNIFWSWSTDLGSDFISSMSWYSIGSPFFWLSLLFPATSYIYIYPWFFMLKYAIAGMTSFAYLGRFVKDKKWAILGSVLYAFSGFQSINILFNHFHDVVAFFPLLLIGVEKITEEDKKGWLIFAVCLSALTNYYFMVQQVIFVVLYYLVKNGFCKVKKMFRCLMEGVLGMGCAAILFLPSVFLTMENPRVSELLSRDMWFDFGRRYMLQTFRVFFFPGETMGLQSNVYTGNWSSWSAYLPLVGMTFVICFFLRKKWGWLHRLLILLFLMAYIPLLNCTFTLFSNLIHYRWFFMLILMMALASAMVLDQEFMEEKEKKKVVIISWIVVITVVCSYVGFLWWDKNMFELIFDRQAFNFISILGILGYIITAVTVTMNRKTMYVGLLVGSLTIGAVNMSYNILDYKNSLGENNGEYYNNMQIYSQLEELDGRYRYNTTDNQQIFYGAISPVGAWHSTISGSIYSFWHTVSSGRGAHAPELTESMESLFGVGYDISWEKRDNQQPVQTIERDGRTLYVYEREGALPIGYTYDSYMTRSELDNYDMDVRAKVMLQTLVVPDEYESVVASILEKADMSKECSTEELTELRRKESSSSLIKNRKGFVSVIEAKDERYAFYSVPYSDNWKAMVNGEETEIIDCCGFMAVKLDKGVNEVEFTYFNNSVLIGAVITFMSMILSVIYIKKINGDLMCSKCN